MNEKFVFHGSPRTFDGESAIPRQNMRVNEAGEVIFDEISFHATPHKWIALAYTYTQVPIEGMDGDDAFYSMGVNLDSDTKEVAIYGVGSLEESLKVLYGNGGYLYHFDNGGFVYKEGLGSQEVISSSEVTPLHTERIDDPVAEMQKLGVKFVFFNMIEKN